MEEWTQLASMMVIVMSLLTLLLMVVVVYILQDSYKTNIELATQAQKSDTATTTEMGTAGSPITHETLDKATERLGSM